MVDDFSKVDIFFFMHSGGSIIGSLQIQYLGSRRFLSQMSVFLEIIGSCGCSLQVKRGGREWLVGV